MEENSWDLFLDSSRFLLSQLPVDSCNKTIDEPVHQVENIFGNEISRLIPNLEIEFQFEQRRQRPKKRKNFFGGTSSERSVDSARGKNKKKKNKRLDRIQFSFIFHVKGATGVSAMLVASPWSQTGVRQLSLLILL